MLNPPWPSRLTSDLNFTLSLHVHATSGLMADFSKSGHPSANVSAACAGYYSCLSYSTAWLLIEVPYLLGLTIMFTPIVYAMIGLEWTAAKFFW